MKKLLIGTSVVALALAFASQANAASTLAIGGGANVNNTITGAATTSHGLGGAIAGAGAVNTSVGTGVAVSTPLGGISAGVGQSQGLAGSAAAAGGILGGGGAAISGAHGAGLGVGGGFTNSTP
jgi:hypothetical protein